MYYRYRATRKGGRRDDDFVSDDTRAYTVLRRVEMLTLRGRRSAAVRTTK